MSTTTNQFNAAGFGLRLFAALLLVYGSYNPSGYSYTGWLLHGFEHYLPLKIFAGVVLLIGWVVFIRATANSLGALGLLLAAAFFGALIWLLADMGWLPVDNTQAIVYLAEFVVAAVLATGMSWSHVRRRLSGQVDTDEIES